MDNEQIKILRSKIAVPLDIALTLLKKNNGDIQACEQEFHHNNIHEISVAAECDFETAKESYTLCKHDKTKTIEKINSKQVIITTGENPTSRNEPGFILWPEDKNGTPYKTVKRNDAFIPASDFDYIIKAFQSVFPLHDSWNNTIEEHFDVCGDNYFDKEICSVILKKMSQLEINDPEVIKFIKEVTNWFNDKLNYADYIVVSGNL
ncbi:hypothetical protein NAT51_13555 [Flavobacterium amniphilum]|uniref:hypothetical protein n=1 Tax=Flavobacterium amniphilum TaxID=1834035 RepID=UPI00202A1A42|nr:hypothetical protein [Flavobacterium amniphilum]MCL9806556.1 hypothetical protein [Flavobacterium amniphilum]